MKKKLAYIGAGLLATVLLAATWLTLAPGRAGAVLSMIDFPAVYTFQLGDILLLAGTTWRGLMSQALFGHRELVDVDHESAWLLYTFRPGNLDT